MADTPDIMNLPLFEGLSDSDIEALSKQISYKEYKPGEDIFLEGEEGSALYILISGSVRLFRSVRGEEKQTLAILKDGKFFGEMSLLEKRGHTATALALRESKIAILSRENFEKLSDDRPETAYTILMRIGLAICSILRDMDQKMIDMIKYVWEFGART